MLIIFIASIVLFIFGIMIFIKFTIEKNSYKIMGLFLALVCGLSSFYIYSRANSDGTSWINLNKSKETYDLQPLDNHSYLQEDSDYYIVYVKNEKEPLKISKENAVISNSNNVYQNRVVKETTMWVSRKANNHYSFLAKEGEIKYQTFYYIYLDY